MMMTGRSGCVFLTLDKKVKPSIPGIRISVKMTSGAASCKRSSAVCASSKLVTSKPSSLKVFSSTQRMARSSSITQILFRDTV